MRLCDRHARRSLGEDGYDITIITARMKRRLPKRDMLRGKVPVVRVGLGFGFDKWLFPILAPLAARSCTGRPVIIHAILETFAGLALHFCKYLIPSAKRLLTLQTTNRSFLKGFIIRSADKVTAISSALVKIAKDLGRDDVTLIPNGIDLKHIPNVPEVSGRILFVGRLEKWKGVDVLLKAYAQCTHNVCIRIVGDGSERKKLEKLASELGISDRVTFTGFIPVPQVYREFAEAEIFCGLSKSEALGNVFFEAQAAGCAIIGTQVGGIPDIIKDGETGLLVPPDDIEAAADALKRLLRDDDLRRRLAQAGVANAKGYDWELISEKYAEIYGMLQT